MNHKKTIIALAIIMTAIIPVGLVMSDGSDAGMGFAGDVRGDGFSTNGDGTLYVPLRSTEPDPVEMTIVVTEGGREVARKTVTIPGDETYTAELRFRLDGVGVHQLRVTCTPDYYFGPPSSPINYSTVDVTVTESLLNKPSTYIAIIVVAVLIVIAAYMKIRSEPAKKPEMTFTELERQKKEAKGEAEEKPRTSATEKRRYQRSGEASKKEVKQSAPPAEKKAASFTELEKQKSEKKAAAPPAEKKTKPSAPPAEKKATSFTELEKQKSDKKAATAKKESSSEEPKKLKYVSSRRR
ncbi:MAG: hypothetical protein LBH88_01710 [Candidatus Methanoplasma sp.]|jgi:hypothetical protein|nr:hypothetical protein [Candidatus Methanoplasma sp.]